MESDVACYTRMMRAGLFDFALANLREPGSGLATLAWLLTVVQSVIVSRDFDRFEEFANIARMVVIAVADGPDVLRVQAFYILATIVLYDDAGARSVAASDAVLAAALAHLDTALISDVGAVLDYLQNFVSVSDDFTLRALRAGVVERVQELMPRADAAAQARMIDVVANLAVDPPEATDAVFRSELVPVCVDALQTGDMRVKRAAMRLVLNLAAKVPAAAIADFLERGIMEAVVGLLDSDNGGVLEDALRFLLLVLARADAVENAFDVGAVQRIAEIAFAGGALAPLADALVALFQRG
jgi:hypothetical protein